MFGRSVELQSEFLPIGLRVIENFSRLLRGGVERDGKDNWEVIRRKLIENLGGSDASDRSADDKVESRWSAMGWDACWSVRGVN